MTRAVDPRRTRKARRLIERLRSVEVDRNVDFSAWEDEFLNEVDQRLEKYGSSFNDYAKGAPDEAVSRLQAVKLKEIAAKAKGKPRAALKARKPMRAKRPT